MSLNQAFIAELTQEAAATRRMLERVPVSRNDWKPHDRSMSLGRLAMHVVEQTGWITMAMATDELDFLQFGYKPIMDATVEELLEKHDESVEQAIAILDLAKDADFDKMWTLRRGDRIIFTLHKKAVLRSFSLNHMIHHRGQLSVYLRLLDVPLPGMYGPTADDVAAAAILEQEMAAVN